MISPQIQDFGFPVLMGFIVIAQSATHGFLEPEFFSWINISPRLPDAQFSVSLKFADKKSFLTQVVKVRTIRRLAPQQVLTQAFDFIQEQATKALRPGKCHY